MSCSWALAVSMSSTCIELFTDVFIFFQFLPRTQWKIHAGPCIFSWSDFMESKGNKIPPPTFGGLRSPQEGVDAC